MAELLPLLAAVSPHHRALVVLQLALFAMGRSLARGNSQGNGDHPGGRWRLARSWLKQFYCELEPLKP